MCLPVSWKGVKWIWSHQVRNERKADKNEQRHELKPGTQIVYGLKLQLQKHYYILWNARQRKFKHHTMLTSPSSDSSRNRDSRDEPAFLRAFCRVLFRILKNYFMTIKTNLVMSRSLMSTMIRLKMIRSTTSAHTMTFKNILEYVCLNL